MRMLTRDESVHAWVVDNLPGREKLARTSACRRRSPKVSIGGGAHGVTGGGGGGGEGSEVAGQWTSVCIGAAERRAGGWSSSWSDRTMVDEEGGYRPVGDE